MTGFEWDMGNLSKNVEKREVSHLEAEEVFFNEPLVVSDDRKHPQNESRWFVLGVTDKGRKLMIVFTIRDSRIRVISARAMSRKESDL